MSESWVWPIPPEVVLDAHRAAAGLTRDLPADTALAGVAAVFDWVFWADPAPLSARPEPVTPLLVLAEAATADRALFYATGATALAEVLGEVHTRPFRRLTDDFGGDVEVAEPVPAALAYVEGVFRTWLWLLGR
jgi:hypothetical protein